MSDVVLITGKVNYSITLDPGVWIFDDRKKRLEDFFTEQEQEDETVAYQRSIGAQWDKELKEGATIPTTESEKLFVHKKDISGDWGIPLAPFIKNSTPKEGSTKVICHLQNEDKVELSMESALSSILCFALDGRPIREDGPIQLIFGDGSNRENPIKGIIRFEIA